MEERARFNTQTWLLIALIPAIAIITTGLAVLAYLNLHRTILESFDRKLIASSTTTAAHTRGEDHEWLVRRYRPSGAVHDERRDVLLALDAPRDLLLQIDPDTGVAVERAISVRPGVRSLARGPEGMLLTLSGRPREIAVLDPETGGTETFHPLDATYASITAHPAEPVLFLAGDRLASFNWESGEFRMREHALPFAPDALAYDPGENVLYGVGLSGTELLTIDPATGEARERVALREVPRTIPVDGIADEAESVYLFEEYPPDSPYPTAIAYDRTRNRLFGTGLWLLAIDPQTGGVDPDGFHEIYGKERHPLHLYYNYALKRVIEEADLKYIYSMADFDHPEFVYGIDATIDHEDYSPLLAFDAYPESELLGVQRVVDRKAVHTSDIIEWELWGLVKTAYSPILDDDGNVVAVMGADVDIGIIREKTRRAFLYVFFIGVAGVVVGIGATFKIAASLVRPIDALKTMALRIGAGERNIRIDIRSPLEMHRLSQVFNRISETFGRRIDALARSAAESSQSRERIELARLLGHTRDVAEEGSGFTVLWTGPKPYSYETSGCVVRGDKLLAWRASPDDDPLRAARRRSEITRIAGTLMEECRSEALLDSLAGLFASDEVMAWILADAAAGTVRVSSHEQTAGWLFTGGSEGRQVLLRDGEERRLTSGESLLLSPSLSSERRTLSLSETPRAGETGPLARAVAESVDLPDGSLVIVLGTQPRFSPT